jgi:hypothetical protein
MSAARCAIGSARSRANSMAWRRHAENVDVAIGLDPFSGRASPSSGRCPPKRGVKLRRSAWVVYVLRRRRVDARTTSWPVDGSPRPLSVLPRCSSSSASRYSARVRQYSSRLRTSRSSARKWSLSACLFLSCVRQRSSSPRTKAYSSFSDTEHLLSDQRVPGSRAANADEAARSPRRRIPTTRESRRHESLSLATPITCNLLSHHRPNEATS